MRFSKFVLGLSIIDNSFVEGLSAGPDDFDKMILAELIQETRYEFGYGRLRWWEYSPENEKRFRDWISQEHPPYSMIKEQCRGLEIDPSVPEKIKSLLEKMSKADHFLPIATIRGPTRALCLLAFFANRAYIRDDEHLQNSVNETIENFWRNLIAEFFIKTSKNYPVFYQSPTYENSKYHYPPWMTRLANRCNIVATEEKFKNSFIHLGSFLGAIDWNLMGLREIINLCIGVKNMFETEDFPRAQDGFEYVKSLQTQRFELLRGYRLSAQVCYDEVIPEDLEPFEDPLANLIAYDLEMNDLELIRFCNILKDVEDKDDKEWFLTKLALEVMNRIVGTSFENFRLYTGQTLPQSAESRYYAFVARASKQFDFSSIVREWNSMMLLPESEPICDVTGIDPPRLSPLSELWNMIKNLASVEYPSLTGPEKRDFCIIVQQTVQDFYSAVPGELSKITTRLFDLEILRPINKATPQINEICGQRITRMIRSGTGIPQLENLAALDGLVAEAAPISGKIKVCAIISEWNRGRLNEEQLVANIKLAAVPTPAAARVVALPHAHDSLAPADHWE